MATSRPRSLNQIVSHNAMGVVERLRKSASKAGEGFTQAQLARRMAAVMDAKYSTIYRQLDYLLCSEPPRPWRIDYIEGFCAATETSPRDLVTPAAFPRQVHL